MPLAIPTSEWLDEQRRNLARAAVGTTQDPTEIRVVVEGLRGTHELLCLYLPRFERGEAADAMWDLICTSISALLNRTGSSRRVLEQFCDLARTVLIDRPDLNLTLPTDLEEVVWTVRISPLAYLRAMWNLFWSAIRHPLSETTIDLSTGRVLYRT